MWQSTNIFFGVDQFVIGSTRAWTYYQYGSEDTCKRVPIMTRKIPEGEDVALLSLWEVLGGELCANAGVRFISHLFSNCFALSSFTGTSRRSPARSSLTFRSAMPTLAALSWASSARPCPEQLRTSALFGKIWTLLYTLHLRCFFFYATCTSLTFVPWDAIIATQHRREGGGQGWKASSLQGIELPPRYSQLCKYICSGLVQPMPTAVIRMMSNWTTPFLLSSLFSLIQIVIHMLCSHR